MLTIEVAALRTLPKKVVQLMELGLLAAKIVMKGLEHHSAKYFSKNGDYFTRIA
jgi:hypothetical protein